MKQKSKTQYWELVLISSKEEKSKLEQANKTSYQYDSYWLFLKGKIASIEGYLKSGYWPKYKKIGTWESHPGVPWGLKADLVDLGNQL